MKLGQMFNQLSITTRVCVLFVALVGLTAFSARTFFVRQETNDLEMRLQEKAQFIMQTYSLSIAAALMQKDDVMLLQVVNVLERDQEISSVIVVDQRGEIRYHADPHKMGMSFEDPMVKKALKSSEAEMKPYQNAGGRALAMVAPLKVPGMAQPLGAVRIDMTYRRIEDQVNTSRQRYWFIILGSVVSCIGFVGVFMHRWIFYAIRMQKIGLESVNAAVPEPVLRETPDEIGEVSKAANDMIIRFKSELQSQWSNQTSRADQEKDWIQRLALSFLPGARIIIADKDNRVISDTDDAKAVKVRQRPHLLDLIKDANFANLLTAAFQKEGEAVRGRVNFQGKTYGASILSVPLQQATTVKTLIALQQS